MITEVYMIYWIPDFSFARKEDIYLYARQHNIEIEEEDIVRIPVLG